ncbi:hypothetical protein [Streptococcus pluranimalium]|uniref:hypothetical protein n=1 Tax=Streptococcus pluranimalium TaxID=82348 RepID=UPI002930C5D2|nr:hypothetical protein [Streptococcus pluranimalium]
MKIREYKTKSGETAYRATVYLGTDVLTGKPATTSISAKTKRELKAKEKTKQKNGLNLVALKNQIMALKHLESLWKVGKSQLIQVLNIILKKPLITN